MLKKGLVFVSHGSRNAKSNQEIITLVDSLTNNILQKYAMVNYAFLEFAEPSIAHAVEQQITNDMHEIIIYPYFLSNGNHVMVDIPALIHNFAESYPHIKFIQSPVFGSYAGMADLITTLL